MPVIKAGTSRDGSVKGADYGASISLILDESDPEPARDCIATPTTRLGRAGGTSRLPVRR